MTGYSDSPVRLYASDIPHFSKLTMKDTAGDYYEQEELITIYRELKNIYKDELQFWKAREYIRFSKNKVDGKLC